MSIEPIPDELKAMIEAEPAPAPMSADAEARVLSRLDAAISAGHAPVGAAPTSGLAKSALLFIAGGVVGAAIAWALVKPVTVEKIVTVEKTVFVPVFVDAGTPVAIVQPPPELPRVVTRPVAPVGVVLGVDAGAPAVVTSTLAAERQLLEPARAAVARGLASSAIELLERHEREFANGLLAEERDALFVQALAVAGKRAEARDRAVKFESRYPDSLFLPVVQKAAPP